MVDEGNDPVGSLSALLSRVVPFASRVDLVRAEDVTAEVLLHVRVTPFFQRMPFYFGRDVMQGIAALGARLQIEFYKE